MNEFVFLFICIAAFAVQYFLSTRSSAYWGAIIPVIFVSGLTWMFASNRIESTTAYIIILIVGIILLTEEWHRGRKSLQRNRKKELDKMKTYDLK
ncbi:MULTISPECIES: hypothetical protein [Virgibacillus]|uniref:Uncharacterized protein n=2 Tax=Virgibacillus TaxID=84406 RepID=A0A024Q601_9BACI|nr:MULTISPECIES: hypothetical protein [Virgibacillus]EQB38551.1 hypothetical protein M948_08170 [Virgibacillus sp. CM-4]MYL41265.1 hypothetical protein [Virgibacillus massiliensis]CDQ37938.1 hypothetical protein BN990_00204 [Virgibacillus massiliensis]BCT36546.1 hypothetical protein [Virgibacillus salexigens]BCT36555.1 hypothetical protein [Virgibacillus massiliensis]